jgi:hypothetical protein
MDLRRLALDDLVYRPISDYRAFFRRGERLLWVMRAR